MSKATKATFVMLVTLCVHLPVSGHGSAAQGKGLSCGASLNWFPQTPPPTNARPNADSDCDFYRWAWQTFLFVVQSNGGQSGPPRFLEFTTPFELFEFGANRNLRSIPKAHIPHDLSAVVQPGSQGVLVDQGGRAVYYATHLNSVFVKFIRENGYTDPDRLRGAPATQPFPKGSLEIKSSWKVVAPGEDTTRFFTVKTGSKIPPPLSRRIADLNSQGFDPIAKVSELADHSCSARLPRPFANGRTPFLITDPAMQNYPDQPAEPMGNRPDGLLVSQARHQAAIHDLEDASFDLDRGVGTLIENTPHVAVAFRGAVARGHLRALFVSGACANPR